MLCSTCTYTGPPISLSDDLCIDAELMSYEEAFGIYENSDEEELKQVCKRGYGKEEGRILAQSGLEENEEGEEGVGGF